MIIGYDLGHYPITYDFVLWLVRVEEAKKKINESERISLVFQPGENDGFRLKTVRDYQFTKERKLWRLYNILVPIAQAMPSIEAITTTEIKIAEANFAHFDFGKNVFNSPCNPFQASESAKSAIRRMYPEKFVTLTLRQSDIQTERNSNQKEWRKVSKWLYNKDLRVVVVPDTDAVMQGKTQEVNTNECIPAAMNIDLRLALYEMAQFNCFTSGGPMALAKFDENVNYATFKLVSKGNKSCEPDHLEHVGLTDNHSRGEFRKSYWCEDTFENICPKLEPFLDIKEKKEVKDVLNAQTHFRGQLIIQKQQKGNHLEQR